MGEITIRQVIAGADKLWATGHFARRPRSDPQDVPGESPWGVPRTDTNVCAGLRLDGIIVLSGRMNSTLN